MMLLKRIFILATLGILCAMTGCATVQKDAEEQSEYKVGYRRYKWHDGERQRKVWFDVWYPAKDEFEEKPLVYGLGQGSVDNDFLPFEHHAGRYAALIPNAVLIKLNEGEGHFVYLNSCTSKLEANGVPLCVDREGVDREAVHAYLAPKILDFLRTALNLSIGKGSTN